MKNITSTLFLLLFTLSTFGIVYYGLAERKIDPNYSLKFSTRSTDGTFSGLNGTVVFSPEKLEESVIDVSVEAKTIVTGNSKKDEHAKSSDWLDVAKYPNIKFKSASFSKEGESYLVKGTMNLHGVSKEVTIPFSYSKKGDFTGTFAINRSDFGVTGVGMKAKFVGEEIEITYNIPTSLKEE